MVNVDTITDKILKDYVTGYGNEEISLDLAALVQKHDKTIQFFRNNIFNQGHGHVISLLIHGGLYEGLRRAEVPTESMDEPQAAVLVALHDLVNEWGKLFKVDVDETVKTINARLGDAYLKLNDLGKALGSYQDALVADPSILRGYHNELQNRGVNAFIHMGIGDVYLRRGNLQEALRNYEIAEAFIVGRLVPHITFKTALTKFKLGDYKGAIAILEPVIDKHIAEYPNPVEDPLTNGPANSFAYLLGLAYQRLGKLNQVRYKLVTIIDRGIRHDDHKNFHIGAKYHQKLADLVRLASAAK